MDEKEHSNTTPVDSAQQRSQDSGSLSGKDCAMIGSGLEREIIMALLPALMTSSRRTAQRRTAYYQRRERLPYLARGASANELGEEWTSFRFAII